MNGKHYIGRRVSTFKKFNPEPPVTGIRYIVDDENVVEAGDMSGNVWEMENPYATQEMADSVLAALSGRTYTGFEASNAVLGADAELGDGVTINGLYSVLAYRNLTFGPGHMSNIAAPGDDEPEEEYKYVTPQERREARQLAQVRSSISKTAESITLRVDGLDGNFSELKTTLDGVTIQDESGETRIKGSSIETESIDVGSIRADQVNLKGSISWGDLDGDTQGRVSSAQSAASSAQGTVSGWTYPGSTLIDGRKLMTDTVMATKLLGGSVSLLDSSENSVGTFSILNTSSGYGVEITTNKGGIRLGSAGNFWVDTSSGSFGFVDGNMTVKGNVVPNTTQKIYSLGASYLLWSEVYAENGAIQTSDANRKHDIEDLPEKYIALFDGLKPRRYKMNDGTSNRYHTGFIAQEVESAMEAAGIDSSEFGGFVRDKDAEGKDIYMLRYDEFMAILAEKVKCVEQKYDELVRTLSEKIEQLESNIKRLEA